MYLPIIISIPKAKPTKAALGWLMLCKDYIQKKYVEICGENKISKKIIFSFSLPKTKNFLTISANFFMNF